MSAALRSSPSRSIPSVDRVLKLPAVEALVTANGHSLVVAAVRATLEECRASGSYDDDRCVTAVARRTQGPNTRLGFAVSRRVGGAVIRNRVKRQLRMIARTQSWHAGFDVVIVPQPACAAARFDEIARAFASSCEKLGILMGNEMGNPA
mgnify:CR=1 FL=1